MTMLAAPGYRCVCVEGRLGLGAHSLQRRRVVPFAARLGLVQQPLAAGEAHAAQPDGGAGVVRVQAQRLGESHFGRGQLRLVAAGALGAVEMFLPQEVLDDIRLGRKLGRTPERYQCLHLIAEYLLPQPLAQPGQAGNQRLQPV